jgi:hypothetical protein
MDRSPLGTLVWMGPDEVVGPPVTSVVETDIDGCVVLFHPETAEVVILNATASDVWRLSDGNNTLTEMIAILARAYHVDTKSIKDDVLSAVSLLEDYGLFLRR